MDIFTTQLTRVVPVPIKPASLKVKALLKEAANSKLTQDPDHLENHEYYFTSEEDQYHASKEEAKHESKKDKPAPESSEPSDNTGEDSDKSNHLDLYA